MVATTFKEKTVSNKRQKVNVRSYKNFQEADFVRDLHRAPFHVFTLFDDADDCYWAYETLLIDIVDEHAHRKQKYPQKYSPPLINSELRKAIYKKEMLRNKCLLLKAGTYGTSGNTGTLKFYFFYLFISF